MNTWILDAIDPLFFGDGRSIGTGDVHSRILPPPQTVAGLARTRQGLNASGAWVGDPEAAKRIAVQGPFPALLAPDGRIADWLFPRPADALRLFEGDNPAQTALHCLVPLDLGAWGVRSNLPQGVLAPVGLKLANPSKPAPMRAFWRWSELEHWLTQPETAAPIEGVEAPPVEARVHIAIDPHTGRAKEGALFTTTGRRMITQTGSLGIGLRTGAAITPGAAAAGGERRMVRWRKASQPLPSAPEAVLQSAEAGAVRVILATPAIFERGWCPTGLFDAPEGSALVAASVGRAEVVSGWDLAARKARPTRRCAPAGSVYFLKLGGSPAQRRAWAEQAWLAPRSDADSDRLDGYGSLLLGVWSGQLTPPASSKENR